MKQNVKSYNTAVQQNNFVPHNHQNLGAQNDCFHAQTMLAY